MDVDVVRKESRDVDARNLRSVRTDIQRHFFALEELARKFEDYTLIQDDRWEQYATLLVTTGIVSESAILRKRGDESTSDDDSN